MLMEILINMINMMIYFLVLEFKELISNISFVKNFFLIELKEYNQQYILKYKYNYVHFYYIFKYQIYNIFELN